MEPKYFDTLNFVGHWETMQQDAYGLLKSIGAWDKYGKAGWEFAARNNSEIFSDFSYNSTREYDFPGLKKCYGEVNVNYFYRSDYGTDKLNLTLGRSPKCKGMSQQPGAAVQKLYGLKRPKNGTRVRYFVNGKAFDPFA